MPTKAQSSSSGRAGVAPGDDPDEEDFYTLLGVPFTATHAEITRAYRLAIKRAHPDRQHPARRAAAEDLARLLNAAYATLSDPVKRLAYDRTIRQQVIQDQIMRRYVGGFETFNNGARGPAQAHQRREPTTLEREERVAAERQASLSLLFVAVAMTAFIVAAIVVFALLGSLAVAVR